MIAKSANRPNRKNLNPKYDWKEVEAKVRVFYLKAGVQAQLQRKLGRKKALGYVEGPPTLNNQPHVGHVRGRIIKDLWYRHSTMLGKNIVFRGGWDTQGLPVELQAEKELGLTGSKYENLKRVGVEKLVEACKQLIWKYQADWLEVDALIGLMLDQKKAYLTYKDAYIEREWKYLETAWKRGLLGEGFKVVAYCPSCQTSLSHAEVALGGYEKLEDPSLYYKVRTNDGAFLALWTTMPFTVVTDELVAVKPDADYEYVKVGAEVWVVGSERKEGMAKELGLTFGEVVKKVKGAKLEGLEYVHPLLSEIPGFSAPSLKGKVHRVVAEEFVDTSTGTGLVHMSPANGEDDFAVAQKRKVPVFVPLDDQVNFTSEAGKYSGVFARDADKLVVADLEAKGAVVHIGRLTHDYPVCWRSGHRIVWLARREYFYWVDRIRKDLVAAASAVEYYYPSPRNRFLEFIAESPPWGITRERIWGTPLPIWVCEECGEKVAAFSRRRILKLANELPDGRDFELHRPWIDRVVLRCPECGGRARREPFVLDTWHNSGSSPYAAFTDDEFARLFPAPFLTEGIDQTRGWAYTLLVLNVIMKRGPKAPYSSFLFQGHVLDEKGGKMSKSLGNVVWGLDILRANSADLLRYYLMWKCSPEDPLSLDTKEMAGRPFQVLNTMYHLHLYLAQNGAMDGYDPARHTLRWASERRLVSTVDAWLVAKLGRAARVSKQGFESGVYNESAKALEALVIGHLSQTYVRLVRGDLWTDDARGRNRRLAIYAILGEALLAADELMHPVAPFITEYLYQETFARREKWRVPLIVKGYQRRRKEGKGSAEGTVDFALTVEEACNSARAKAGLKRRWPLRTLTILVDGRQAAVARRARRTIASLCNVKQVEVFTKSGEFPASFELRPSPSKLGALFKGRTREVLAAVRPVSGEAALKSLASQKALSVVTVSGRVDVPTAAFDLVTTPREGFEVGEKGGVFAAVSRSRDEKLVAEGLLRDVARRLQALRKERGFVPTQMIRKAEVAGIEEEELALLLPMKSELAFLVRARKVELSREPRKGVEWAKDDLDGRPLFLDVS